MSCCGDKTPGSFFPVDERPAPAAPGGQAPAGYVEFEYTGPTRLVVRGPVTGVRYRFDAPGARIEVDIRDAGFLTGLPNLYPRRRG